MLGQGGQRASFHKWITALTGFSYYFILKVSERGYLSQPEIAHLLLGAFQQAWWFSFFFFFCMMIFRWSILNKGDHFNIMMIYSGKWIWNGIIPDYKARVIHGKHISKMGLPREDKTTVTLVGKPSEMRLKVRQQSKHTNRPAPRWCALKARLLLETVMCRAYKASSRELWLISGKNH